MKAASLAIQTTGLPQMRGAPRSGGTRLVGRFIALAMMPLLAACQEFASPTARDLGGDMLRVQGSPEYLADGATGSSCSLGDARALLEIAPVANQILVRNGPQHPLAQALLTCQYRLFWEAGHPVLGQPISFSERDYFLGGVAFPIPYKAIGMTRAEAEAIQKAIEVQVWLAEVTEGGVGPLVKQALMESALKQTMTEGPGLVLWKQWGFIAKLPPGEYMSVTEVRRPVFFQDELRWTVSVTIIPAGL
jgi:hypothetical protein